MSNPITWQMLEHVRDALELITTARGYNTDIGLHVIALEASQLPEEESPFTLILAGDMPVDEDKSTASTTVSTMDIVVEFAVPFLVDENAQLVAHRARADVMRALLPLRRRPKDLPVGVTSFAITGSGVGQPDAGSTVVIAQVTARAGLVESQPPATP